MSYWEAQGKSDEWFTPKYIFDAMGDVSFDLDVAAPIDGPRFVPTSKWLSADGLTSRWSGFVWMNPPYGGRNSVRDWLLKFIQHGNGIALVPDRTSAPWFQEAVSQMDAVLFVSPKIRFERPDGTLGKSPSNGSALMGCGNTAVNTLNAARNLGWLCINYRPEAK